MRARRILTSLRRGARQAGYSKVTKRAPEAHAQAAAYFFMQPPTWVQRHVETYDLEGLSSARRKLTIDLVMPDDSRAMIARDGRRAVYCIPLVRLSKAKSPPFIDLRDENGSALPLRTRTANDATTREALEQAIRTGGDLGSQELPTGLHDALDILVEDRRRPEAEFAASYVNAALANMRFRDEAVRARIEQVTTHLILNSWVWLVLTCAPGDQRVIKFATTIDLGLPRVPVRKVTRPDSYVRGVNLPPEKSGAVDKTASIRVLRALLAARMGWDSIDLTIRDPTIQDPPSYHLQVLPNAGLDVDRIEFDRDQDVHPAPKLKPEVDGGHFQLRDPDGSLNVAVPVQVSIRVTRRGFLNVCALSSVLITALLWSYQAARENIDPSTEAGAIAAAVLLLVPTFLVLLAGRGHETPLVAALLSGVRAAALACMLASALAAAAIAGVRPTATLSASLILYAGMASVGCAVILIAWLGSWKDVRRIAEAARCGWCGQEGRRRRSWLTVAGLSWMAWLAVVLLSSSALEHPERALLAVGLPAMALLISSWWPQRARIPKGARFLGHAGAAAGAAWCIAVAWPAEVPEAALRGAAELTFAVCAVWALLTIVALWLAPVESPEAGTGRAGGEVHEQPGQTASSPEEPAGVQ